MEWSTEMEIRLFTFQCFMQFMQVSLYFYTYVLIYGRVQLVDIVLMPDATFYIQTAKLYVSVYIMYVSTPPVFSSKP